MIEKYQPLREISNKAKNVAGSIFFFGDTVTTDQLKYAISEGCLTKKLIVRAGLSAIYSILPQKTKENLLKRPFDNSPIKFDDNQNGLSPEKIGSGSTNVVYLLKDGEKYYALSIYKYVFNDTSSAIQYAKRQESEYKFYREMYREIPDLILDESYIVYKRYDKISSVMFMREFIDGPIRDVFSIGRKELDNVLDANVDLEHQFNVFVKITMKNVDYIENVQLDILGQRNLSIAGPAGQERLVLMDPHDKLCKTDKSKKRIHDRISYLEQVYLERSINIGEFFYSALLEHNYTDD